MSRFIFVTDTHGIEIDRKAKQAFFNVLPRIDPDNTAIRIHGGDLWNFESLRSGAKEDEKRVRLKEDFNKGMEFLDEYFDVENERKYLLLGNHDQRLYDAVMYGRSRKSGWLAEYAEELISKFEEKAFNLGIKVLKYDKETGILKIDKLKFAHGYGHGETLTQNMADAFGDIVFGHGHKIVRDTSMKGGETATGYQVGCLARRNMTYVRADLSALRQQHGFAFGDTKDAVVYQIEIRNGKALIPLL